MNKHWSHFNVRNLKKIHLLLTLLFLLGFITSVVTVHDAHAAALAKTLVRFDRLKASTVSTGTVCFQGTTGTNSSSVVVTFPTGFTIDASSGAGHYATDSTNTGWPSGATSITGLSANATNVTSQSVTWTFTSANMSSGLKCFNWLSTGNPVTTGSAATYAGSSQTVVLSNGDTGNYAVQIVSNDQIAVTASVLPTFTFTLTGTSDNLPALDSASVKTSSSPSTVAVSTNAANGWLVWAKDVNQGLTSTTASNTISNTCSGGTTSATVYTLSAGSPGYNFGVEKSGVGTIDAHFARASTNYKGGDLCVANQVIASHTALSTGTTLTLYNSASISATTAPATDYTDTITITGAGLF